MVAQFRKIQKIQKLRQSALLQNPKGFARSGIILPLAVLWVGSVQALAQGLLNPGDSRYPTNSNPPYQSGSGSGGVGANIWNTVGNTRIPIGTLLSGVLEDNLSSAKSQRGDVFSIRIEDGYFRNGVEVLPRHSRIVGAVVSVVPSMMTGRGHPGNLQVSLQTIVFPDGRNTPIGAFLVHNPNMDEVTNPKKSSATQAAGYYPRATMNSLAMVGRTLSGRFIGIKPNIYPKGEDFKLEKGEILAVRLNRSLDLTHMSPPPTGFSPGSLPIPGLASPTVPGLTSGQPLLPDPRLAPNAASGGLIPNGTSRTNPNQIFDNPVGPKPGPNMPDPF